MHKSPKKNSNTQKGKVRLAFFSHFHKALFVISGIFFIVALTAAYLTYTEVSRAKDNEDKSLQTFERLLESSDLKLVDPRLESLKTNKKSEDLVSIQPPLELQGRKLEAEVAILNKDSKVDLESQKSSVMPIAKLEIKKIALKTSVLSEWSYELLDISVNKFHGPEPNELGNFIVIGHNYTNEAHFGSLYRVEIGDLIELTDLSGRKITYEVFEVLIIKPDEVEKLKTDHPLALTLITCDTDNSYRLVVKSKALDQ